MLTGFFFLAAVVLIAAMWLARLLEKTEAAILEKLDELKSEIEK
jgi:hypothetical protein